MEGSPRDHIVQFLLLKEVHLVQVEQDCVPMVSENLQRRTLHHLSSQPAPVLSYSHSKEV